VLFRIFLLSLCLLSPSLHAQEASAQEAATDSEAAVEAPPSATSPAKPPSEATRVPLDPAALLAVGAPRSKAERDEMVARSVTLRAESKQRREAAEKTHEAAKVSCWKKFLVSSCLEDARLAYRKDLSLSKRQEREAQGLDRNVHKYDVLERVRLRDEENAKREAENAKKADKHRAKRALEEQEKAEQKK
jgi:hypothetical protein